MDKINVRKQVAEAVFSRAFLDLLPGEDARVERDPRNPYAMAVAVGSKKFRVIVKEVEQG
jgi:hypothetical protein